MSLLAWAISDPSGAVPWLNRHVNLFVALTFVAAAYLNSKALPDSVWDNDEFRRVGGVIGGLALAVLVVVLIQQIPQFDPVSGKTPLDPSAIGAVLIAILVLLALSLQFALRPARDPLGPTPHGRAGYVYLAELLLVFLFAHVRLNVPQIFTGQAVRYWTFIVMLLAFAGVGLAELFARRGLHVLARPLLRTGVLLPLIPLLAFWAKPPKLVFEFADAKAPGLRPMLGLPGKTAAALRRLCLAVVPRGNAVRSDRAVAAIVWLARLGGTGDQRGTLGLALRTTTCRPSSIRKPGRFRWR